jgi:hypothetical protein
MKTRYYLYRMGDFIQSNEVDLSQYQGYYCLDMGHDLSSPTFGMIAGGVIRPLSLDKFPLAFRTHLLVLDVP